MSYLLDTNCYLRLADKNSPLQTIVLNAIKKLRSQNEIIYTNAQIIAEFWNVCTRPSTVRGGLGLTPKQAERKTDLILKHFVLLPDSLRSFETWREIVSTHQVSGVAVHDAKLVASMVTHAVANLVTLNERDFRRYKMIAVFDPHDI